MKKRANSNLPAQAQASRLGKKLKVRENDENALKNLGHGGTGLPQPQNVGMEIRHDLQNDTIATNLTVPQNYLQFFAPDPLPLPSEQVEPLATINPALLVLQHPVPQSSRSTPAYVNHDYSNISAAKTIHLREDSGRGGNDSATEYDSTEDENGVSGVRNTDGHGDGNECNDPNYHNSNDSQQPGWTDANLHTQFGANFDVSVNEQQRPQQSICGPAAVHGVHLPNPGLLAVAKNSGAEPNKAEGPGEQKISPRRLRFHSLPWQAVLEGSKRKLRFWLATENPWPAREASTLEARKCLDLTLAERTEAGEEFESGYLQMYRNDMVAHIADDVANWRSEMKKYARAIVLDFYPLTPHMTGGHGQEEYYYQIRVNVESLLESDSYLMDGVDEQGRTNNFAHPALCELFHKAFFASDSTVYVNFFEHGVPPQTLAFMATCIKASLDEWTSGKETSIRFSLRNYFYVYIGLLRAVERIKADEYHGPKLQQVVQDWVETGMELSQGRHSELEQGVEVHIRLD